jgi:hypothetical protein
MPRVAAFRTVPVSVLLLAGLILPVFAGANPLAQTEAAKTPEPGLMLTVETVEPPGIDIKLYLTAVAAVLRHSWPSKMQANLITRGDKGIVFVHQGNRSSCRRTAVSTYRHSYHFNPQHP